MHDRHGRIRTESPLKHHRSHGFSDDVAASDDDHVFTRCLHTGTDDHLLHARRGGGKEIGITDEDAAHIGGVEAIHVLGR